MRFMAKDSSQGIEYFLWSKTGQKSDKLIYYDREGHCIEKPIPEGLLEDALKLFDGNHRAVQRTTGGISLAEPFQIVFYPPSDIRIRVRLRDLVRNKEGFVIHSEPVHQLKVVPFSHLRPAFPITTENSQSFGVDFGQGPIAIHLFHLEKDPSGKQTVFFVLWNTLQQVINTPQGDKIALHPFRLPIEALRQMDGTLFKISEKRLLSLAQCKQLYLPDSLIASPPIPIPTGSSLEMVRHFLRISIKPEDSPSLEPLFIRIEKKDELLPFGIFEQS